MLLHRATSEKIRVGFVVHVMQVAGAEMLVTQLIERLHDKIDPVVFCLDAIGALGERLMEAGVPVVVLNRSPGIDYGLPWRFAREIRKRKIDVLHAHQYTPYFYAATAKLCGAWGVKIIFTEHGRHYPDEVSWKRRLANRTILSRLSFDRTACCDFSARATELNDGFHHVKTIANGVDLENIQPLRDPFERSQLRQSLGLRNDLLYVGCIARFHPVKDHPMLLRAWKRVCTNMPQARLLLVGDGPEKVKLKSLANELGISDSVEFWGVRNDVPNILRSIDVFTLTSVTEASSLTLLEAMACACPVVITDVGGNGEHVTDGVEGWLVPRHDDESLAERLQQTLRDHDQRSRMAAHARLRVERQFSLENTLSNYEDLFLSAGKDRRS
jgi:glycosyltransferase involved in cell wall biosynthesis